MTKLYKIVSTYNDGAERDATTHGDLTTTKKTLNDLAASYKRNGADVYFTGEGMFNASHEGEKYFYTIVEV